MNTIELVSLFVLLLSSCVAAYFAFSAGRAHIVRSRGDSTSARRGMRP